ncbi:hypothetical protein RUM44_007493 [Polyplax serrata]|uniref:Uncharacterized protein n=1 Tax=Polyplax serrata TaxID=468196 RepID=A0ABR1B0W2_POLSC
MNVLCLASFLGAVVYVQGRPAMCPDECTCSSDEWGRRQVICSKGGLRDPIPIGSVEEDVEVFKISAPVNDPNFLTIGPIFQKFFRLEQLELVRSNIPAIGKHSFWGVPTLKQLNLMQNNISHILEHNFRGLVNLIELHLDENRIESMPSETFRHLRALKVLTLSGNRIHELVPRLFIMVGKLQELDLSRNPLNDLNPEVFKDIHNLRKFKCRRCHLTSLNKLIYQLLNDLTELDLGENEFKYLKSHEFHSLRKLKVLKLDNNLLTVVNEYTFAPVTSKSKQINEMSEVEVALEEIDLSRNYLAKINIRSFSNLTSLTSIDISYNKLDKLEFGTFLPVVSSLKRLNISGNLISMSDLKSLFQISSQLTHVSLSDMELSNFPQGLFAYQENLRYLNLSGNRFAFLPPHVVTMMTRVQILDLSRNHFRGLNERIIVRLEKVARLFLEENPWACDLCHIPPILNRVNKTEVGASFRDLTCKSPHALAGRTVSSLQADELGWCSNSETSGDMTDDTSDFMGMPGRLIPKEATAGIVLALLALALFFLSGISLLACMAYYRRRRTNHYYTREEHRSQTESFFENPSAVHNGHGNSVYKLSREGSLMKKKKVTIATIDEIVKYPEHTIFANGPC